MVKHMGFFHRGVRALLNACIRPVTKTASGNTRIFLLNQPKQMQRFGSPFVVPRIQIDGYVGEVRVIASLVTEDQMRPHPHRLEGPGCKQGLCFHKAGKRDPIRRHWEEAYDDLWPVRRGEQRSTEQIRKYEWKVTRELFMCLWEIFWNMLYAKTTIEMPNLRIKPTGEYSVRTALIEREQFSRKKTDFWRNVDKAGPPGDPWKLGFSHKSGPIELSAVRIAFQVNYGAGPWVAEYKLLSDIIYDSTPRIIESSLNEADCEGGSVMSLKVNRDDVAVEFFDQDSWSVRLEVGSQSGSGFEALDLESPEQLPGPYTATLEVEVPPYPKVSINNQKVFVRLLTRATGEQSEPIAFNYLPSKDAAHILKAKEEKTEESQDFYSRLLEKEEKPDYWAMVKKDAEKAPPVKIVLRPEREKRTSKELPSYVTDEAHKKAAQEEIMKKMFKSKR